MLLVVLSTQPKYVVLGSVCASAVGRVGAMPGPAIAGSCWQQALVRLGLFQQPFHVLLFQPFSCCYWYVVFQTV